jgi:hypothetical protein
MRCVALPSHHCTLDFDIPKVSPNLVPVITRKYGTGVWRILEESMVPAVKKYGAIAKKHGEYASIAVNALLYRYLLWKLNSCWP